MGPPSNEDEALLFFPFSCLLGMRFWKVSLLNETFQASFGADGDGGGDTRAQQKRAAASTWLTRRDATRKRGSRARVHLASSLSARRNLLLDLLFPARLRSAQNRHAPEINMCENELRRRQLQLLARCTTSGGSPLVGRSQRATRRGTSRLT